MLCCPVVHVLILQTCKGNPQHRTCWLYLRHHSVLGLPGGCISSPSPSVCSAAALGLSWACKRAWQWSQRLWQGLSISGAAPSLSLHQETLTSHTYVALFLILRNNIALQKFPYELLLFEKIRDRLRRAWEQDGDSSRDEPASSAALR